MQDWIAVSHFPPNIVRFYKDLNGEWILVLENKTLYCWQKGFHHQSDQIQKRASNADAADSSDVETITNLIANSRCQMESLKDQLSKDSNSFLKSNDEALATCQLNVRCLEDVRSGLLTKANRDDKICTYLAQMEELLDCWRRLVPDIENQNNQKLDSSQMMSKKDHCVPIAQTPNKDHGEVYDNVVVGRDLIRADDWTDNSSMTSSGSVVQDGLVDDTINGNDFALDYSIGDDKTNYRQHAADNVCEYRRKDITVCNALRQRPHGFDKNDVSKRRSITSGRSITSDRSQWQSPTIVGQDDIIDHVHEIHSLVKDLSNEFLYIERMLTNCESKLRCFENNLSGTSDGTTSSHDVLEIHRCVQAELLTMNGVDDHYEQAIRMFNELLGENSFLPARSPTNFKHSFSERIRRIQYRKQLLKQWCSDLLLSSSSTNLPTTTTTNNNLVYRHRIDEPCSVEEQNKINTFRCSLCVASSSSSCSQPCDCMIPDNKPLICTAYNYQPSDVAPSASVMHCSTIQQRRLHYIRRFWRSTTSLDSGYHASREMSNSDFAFYTNDGCYRSNKLNSYVPDQGEHGYSNIRPGCCNRPHSTGNIEMTEGSRSSSSFNVDEGISIDSADSVGIRRRHTNGDGDHHHALRIQRQRDPACQSDSFSRKNGTVSEIQTANQGSSLPKIPYSDLTLSEYREDNSSSLCTTKANHILEESNSLNAEAINRSPRHSSSLVFFKSQLRKFQCILLIILCLLLLFFTGYYFVTIWRDCSRISFYRHLKDIVFPLDPPIC